MPSPKSFLTAYEIFKGAFINPRTTITRIAIKHVVKQPHAKYDFPMEIEVVSTDPLQNILQDFCVYVSTNRTIYSHFQNPYLCGVSDIRIRKVQTITTTPHSTSKNYIPPKEFASIINTHSTSTHHTTHHTSPAERYTSSSQPYQTFCLLCRGTAVRLRHKSQTSSDPSTQPSHPHKINSAHSSHHPTHPTHAIHAIHQTTTTTSTTISTTSTTASTPTPTPTAPRTIQHYFFGRADSSSSLSPLTVVESEDVERSAGEDV